MSSIGIMGGTFDPPHYGHLAVAEEVLHRLQLDSILWVPAGTPPHKPDNGVSPVGDRVEMLRLAISGNPYFEMSEIELRREGPSYTAETLSELSKLYTDRQLVFLLGSDEFSALRTWHQPDRIPQLAYLAVMSRGGTSFDPTRIEAEVPQVRGRYTIVPVTNIPLSSSELRDRVREGLPIRYLVPEPVREYITEHGLYT